MHFNSRQQALEEHFGDPETVCSRTRARMYMHRHRRPSAEQQLTLRLLPRIITPPAGNSAFLVGHARGLKAMSAYRRLRALLPPPGPINAARPEATLFQSFFGNDFQIVTHFLSPNTNPKTPRGRYPSVMPRGRVRSIAAGCGQRSCTETR